MRRAYILAAPYQAATVRERWPDAPFPLGAAAND
jgi:hypothetical protein